MRQRKASTPKRGRITITVSDEVAAFLQQSAAAQGGCEAGDIATDILEKHVRQRLRRGATKYAGMQPLIAPLDAFLPPEPLSDNPQDIQQAPATTKPVPERHPINFKKIQERHEKATPLDIYLRSLED